eukprot:3149165-Amphidinium_carterae.1
MCCVCAARGLGHQKRLLQIYSPFCYVSKVALRPTCGTAPGAVDMTCSKCTACWGQRTHSQWRALEVVLAEILALSFAIQVILRRGAASIWPQDILKECQEWLL